MNDGSMSGGEIFTARLKLGRLTRAHRPPSAQNHVSIRLLRRLGFEQIATGTAFSHVGQAHDAWTEFELKRSALEALQ